jgi:hypothetical protein
MPCAISSASCVTPRLRTSSCAASPVI